MGPIFRPSAGSRFTFASGWRLTAAIAVALAIGCNTSQPRPESPNPGRASTIVLAPVNFDQLTATQLESGLEPTADLVALFLKHRGFEVERVRYRRFTELWNEAVGGKAVAPDDPEFGQAAASVLARVVPGQPDAALLVSKIVYRNGKLRGTTASWDGVRERVIVDNMPKNIDAHFNNDTRCVSLWIRVFDATGAIAHAGYGGVGLPWKYTAAPPHGSQSDLGVTWLGMEMVDRSDLFDDPRKLARAIKIAMDPYTPRE